MQNERFGWASLQIEGLGVSRIAECGIGKMKDREVECRNLRTEKKEYPQNEGLIRQILQIADLEIMWLQKVNSAK